MTITRVECNSIRIMVVLHSFVFATAFSGSTSAIGSITSLFSGIKPTLIPEERTWGGTKTGLERAAAIDPYHSAAMLSLGETKGRFTRYDFVARDKLTTGLRHELFRVNQTYNLPATVVYVTKNVVGF